MRKSAVVAVGSAIIIIFVAALIAVPLPGIFPGTHATSAIGRVQSGLVAYDVLGQNGTQQSGQNQTLHFGGDAPGGRVTVFEDSAYLHIGVAAPANGSWAGYYAVTPDTYARLVHAVLTAPPSTIKGYFVNGLYVQSSLQVLNYVTCASITNSTGTFWVLVHAKNSGSSTSTTDYEYLWKGKGANQPLTRDCTILTNGENSLTVYLDHVKIFESNSLNLGMREPFNYFVGVETAYAGQLTYGSYRDFYVALGDSVKVTNLPSDAKVVDLVATNGTVMATGPVVSGRASIGVANYRLPLAGYIRAFDSSSSSSNSSMVAWTNGTMNIAGGDVYSAQSSPSTTSQLTIDSSDGNGNELSGYYTTLTQGNKVLASDYLPTTFTLNNGQTYTILVSDYGNYVFDHWSDGSISRIRTISISNDTQLAAIFRDVHAPPPSGHSIITVGAVDSAGKAIPGFYATLWQNGFLIASAYSPASFVVDNNYYYQISVSGYGHYTFSHWSDGSKSEFSTMFTGVGTQSSVVAVYSG